MKNLFNVIVIALSLLAAYLIYYLILGSPDNFIAGDRHQPQNVLGMIFTGGPLVGLLMSLIIIAICYAIERGISISMAKGKSSVSSFVKNLQQKLVSKDYDGAVQLCEKQKGSLANVMGAAINRYREIKDDDNYQGEKKLKEIQRVIDEAVNLETPLLEKNLVILSTVASIATMVGLLGTTVGMIRAFAALGKEGGTIDAVQLSIGISEALYNTAGGLAGAIIAITAYNFYTTVVDNYVYMIDEAALSITSIFVHETND